MSKFGENGTCATPILCHAFKLLDRSGGYLKGWIESIGAWLLRLIDINYFVENIKQLYTLANKLSLYTTESIY